MLNKESANPGLREHKAVRHYTVKAGLKKEILAG